MLVLNHSNQEAPNLIHLIVVLEYKIMPPPSSAKSNGEKLPKHVEEMAEYLTKAGESFEKRWMNNVVEVGCFDDFVLKKIIGTGAFGVVFLVRTYCVLSFCHKIANF